MDLHMLDQDGYGTAGGSPKAQKMRHVGLHSPDHHVAGSQPPDHSQQQQAPEGPTEHQQQEPAPPLTATIAAGLQDMEQRRQQLHAMVRSTGAVTGAAA